MTKVVKNWVGMYSRISWHMSFSIVMFCNSIHTYRRLKEQRTARISFLTRKTIHLHMIGVIVLYTIHRANLVIEFLNFIPHFIYSIEGGSETCFFPVFCLLCFYNLIFLKPVFFLNHWNLFFLVLFLLKNKTCFLPVFFSKISKWYFPL